MPGLILVLKGLVIALLFLAAIGVPKESRVNLGWLGLFFAALVVFLGGKG